MFKKKVVAIIPARGGSKGIINKNLRILNGKPLIQHSIDFAKKSQLIDDIIVSTDSNDIQQFSISQGVKVILRPDYLSSDSALVIDAIRYTISVSELNIGYIPDIIVLLECTSPIKNIDEINLAIQLLIADKADSVATFKETEISPYRIWKIVNEEVSPYIEGATPFLPRQSQPKAYQLTGQVYALNVNILMQNPNAISILLGRLFPIITNTAVVDIDTEMDLIVAEQILKNI